MAILLADFFNLPVAVLHADYQSCTSVVVVLRVKIGPFCRYNVTPSQLLFVLVLLAIRWLFLVCSRLRRGRSDFYYKVSLGPCRIDMYYTMLLDLRSDNRFGVFIPLLSIAFRGIHTKQ